MDVSVHFEQYVNFFQLFLSFKRLNIYLHPSIKQEQVWSFYIPNYYVEQLSMLEFTIDEIFTGFKSAYIHT